jgi:hypothetical protein
MLWPYVRMESLSRPELYEFKLVSAGHYEHGEVKPGAVGALAGYAGIARKR